MSVSSLFRLRSLCGSLRLYSQPIRLAHVLDQLEILASDVLPPAGRSRVVRLGSTVLVEDLSYDGQAELALVSPDRADPDQGRISVFSPLGAALLGASVGEILRVDLCGRDYRFLLVDILDSETADVRKHEEGMTP